MKAVIISNSMLKSLQTCETQAWLRTQGYGVSAQEPKRLRAGKDAHLAFEKWLLGSTCDEALEAFQAAYRPYSDLYLESKDAYHLDNLSRVLAVFFNSNPLPAMPFEVVAVEQQLGYQVAKEFGVEYIVTDKSDGIVRMRDTGDLMSIEHKTTGDYIGEDYIKNFTLDSQVTTHVAACRALGWDVKGVILQVVKFSKLPDPLAVTPKTGKPARCRMTNHGYVKDCWTQHVQFQRYLLTRDDESIIEWQDNVEEQLRRYKTVVEHTNVQVLSQAGLFGSCGRCDFLPFCASHRRNFDGLVKRTREPDVTYSGIYEREEK